ncbi:TonB-dependent siderophore receptor [Anaerosinus massiliensis]|uniref:TonB-dependent siderophore receptor n=1 Tax=Massilibacillus massiliensis TaxID=1806837 RepID=UPI000DA63A08|nr:TonB-dependent siderophore receptor [Massilibacillus massiliensis]
MRKLSSFTRKRLLYVLVGSGLIWQWPYAAAAEEANDPQVDVRETAVSQIEFTLEGMEVTADKETPVKGHVAKYNNVGTKTNAALINIPQSVSVVTREQMDARGATNLTQALEYNAGVTSNQQGTDYRWNSSLVRGFNVDRRVDGLQLVTNQFALWDFEQYGLEQVAVLRGPASTLYGSNAPGGMFNLVSKRPKADQVNEIQIQGGNDDYRSVALDIGGKIDGHDNLTFRLTGLTREQDLPVDYSSFKRKFIAPSLAWNIDPDTTITFQTHYLKDEMKGSDEGNSLYRPNSDFYGRSGRLFLGQPGYTGYQREQYYYGYLLDHRLDDTWSFHQNFRYGKTNTVYNMNWATLQSDKHTVTFDPLIYDDTATSYQLDTYGEAKWKNGTISHQAIVGIDYRHGKLTNRYGAGGSIPAVDLDDLHYGTSWLAPETAVTYKGKVKQTGIYLQDQIDFGEKWSATLNGRKDWYKQNGVNPQNGAITEIDQDAFTGRAGLVYHATKELSPYISYAKSFEPQSGRDRSSQPFVPTTGQQYEVGIQYEPVNMDARFTVALFDLRQQNVLTADPIDTNFSIQTGEIASKGLELEANMVAFKDLRLTASYTILDNKITKSTDAAAIGRRTAGVSKHTAALWLDTAKDKQIQSGWNAGIGVRYIGSRYNTDNSLKLNGVWLADASIRYNTTDWQYQLNVRNLFDKFYEASAFDNTRTFQGEQRTLILTATRYW